MVIGIDDLLIMAAASAAIGELVKGPVGNVLSGIIPHDVPAVRTFIAAYINGSCSREDFLKAQPITSMDPSSRGIMINYADTMRAAKITSSMAARNKGVISELTDINNNYDKLTADALDIEFDVYSNEVNNEIDKVQNEQKIVSGLLTNAVKKDDVIFPTFAWPAEVAEAINKAPSAVDAVIRGMQAYDDKIMILKQLIQAKRIEMDKRKKEILDAMLMALPELVTENISAQQAYKYVKEFMIESLAAPDPQFILTKYDYPINSRNIRIVQEAVKSVESNLPAVIAAHFVTPPTTAEILAPSAAAITAPATPPATTPPVITAPAAFAGPYQLLSHYVINSEDVYEIKSIADGSIEYWSKEIYDLMLAAGKVLSTPATAAVVPLPTQLTAEQTAALAAIQTAKIITAAMMQSLQPYPSPPVVTTPAHYEYVGSEQLDGYWLFGPVGGSRGRTQTITDVIMHMRDNMRENGFGVGWLHITYKDGSTETREVYA